MFDSQAAAIPGVPLVLLTLRDEGYTRGMRLAFVYFLPLAALALAGVACVMLALGFTGNYWRAFPGPYVPGCVESLWTGES